MPIVNSNNVEFLIASASPTANAANTTFQTIGHATSVTLDISRENIVTTSKASNSHVTRIPGVRDWSASVEGYVDFDQADQNLAGTSTAGAGTVNASDIFTLMNAGTTVYMRFGVGDKRFVGQGLINSDSISAGTDEAGTWNFTIEASDELAYDADVTAA